MQARKTKLTESKNTSSTNETMSTTLSLLELLKINEEEELSLNANNALLAAQGVEDRCKQESEQIQAIREAQAKQVEQVNNMVSKALLSNNSQALTPLQKRAFKMAARKAQKTSKELEEKASFTLQLGEQPHFSIIEKLVTIDTKFTAFQTIESNLDTQKVKAFAETFVEFSAELLKLSPDYNLLSKQLRSLKDSLTEFIKAPKNDKKAINIIVDFARDINDCFKQVTLLIQTEEDPAKPALRKYNNP